MKNLKTLSTLLFIAFLFPVWTFAQSNMISGKVYNANGEGLSGVEVRIKGHKDVSVITDENGNYSVEINDLSSDVLVFSKADFDTREIDVRGQKDVSLKMFSNARYNAYGKKVKRNPAKAEFRNGILTFETEDQNFKLWFDNRVYIDMAYFPSNDVYNDIGNGINVRRARFAIKARLWKHWGAELDVDFAGATIEMKDMYIQYFFMKANQDYAHIRVGNFREAFSMEETTTSRYVSFIERSLVNKIAPGRHLGAAFTTWGKKYLFIGGVHFNSTGEFEEVTWSQDYNKDAGIDEGYSLTARAVFTPLNDEIKVVHIGAGYSYRTPKTSDEVYEAYRYSTRSLSSINRKKYLDTDDIINVKNRTLYNVELAAAYKNFMFQSEYIGQQMNGTDVNGTEGINQAKIDGMYAQVGWLIFGGKYNYNIKEGEFTQVSRGKYWGDIELVYRFDYMNANDFDAEIYGGAANAHTIGINYHVNPNVKFMLNYSYLDHDRYANGKGKLYIGHDAEGNLTKDFTKAVEPAGEGGDDFGMIQARIEIDF